MFDIRSASLGDEERVGDSDDPKIEADPFTGRLFVRARPAQIAAIERAIEQIEQIEDPDLGDNKGVKLLPYRGDRAKDLLESAKEFWPHEDDLQILPSPGDRRAIPLEREINPAPRLPNPPSLRELNRRRSAPPEAGTPNSDDDLVRIRGNPVYLVKVLQNDARQRNDNALRPKIRAQWTPRGILVYSDDAAALRRFEEHLQTISGSREDATHRLAVFYLKHADVDEANSLLQRLLDAEYYVSAESQIFGAVGMGSSFMDNVIDVAGLGDADSLWSSGSATVIPDARLNRMFVYGTPEDLTAIEKHLEVIDRESSIAEIKTYGAPRVVKLLHARASDAAEIIRDAYSGRISATAKERQAAEQQRQQNTKNQKTEPGGESRQESPSATRGAQPPTGKSPRMTLAVDVRSNALIITAPDQLATQVEQLAKTIDAQAEQSIQVQTISGGSAEEVYQSLSEMLGNRPEARPPANQRRNPE
jgi:type II secretory pathway component GspD/PulD (secretin)